MFRNILVPTDGSPLSEKAADAAIEVARAMHGQILALSVAEPFAYSSLSPVAIAGSPVEFEEHSHGLATQHVDSIRKRAEASQVPCRTLVTLSFSPSEEIIEAARKEGCDAIVMASRGHHGLTKLFLGSETQKVLATADIPVTVIH